MTLFLILAPYGAFTVLMLVMSAAVSLSAAAAICLGVTAIDVVRGRSVKILSAGSALLFAGLAFYVARIDPGLEVTTAVDAGIFLISFGSMLVGRPFTLQYALEAASADVIAMPGFVRANYAITAAWTAATLVMMVANVAFLYLPGLPIWSSLVVGFAARNSAVTFTKWYPKYRTARYRARKPVAASADTLHRT